ncbi:hypothetical protein BJ508DRAFT_312149 [Ascobolus immersus RN42]|uniref:Uncharacterized protein n=1 Tax=Ascobolus immersus RN42 TaxID=1160509 RepID=A0A3N4HQH9_ASCIM|nr:hypothetical protein BJ508DRAFT_312149 [Ascobolus immersus RN42]
MAQGTSSCFLLSILLWSLLVLLTSSATLPRNFESSSSLPQDDTTEETDEYLLLNNPNIPKSDCLIYLSTVSFDNDTSFAAFTSPTSPCLTVLRSSIPDSSYNALDILGSAECRRQATDPPLSHLGNAAIPMIYGSKSRWCRPRPWQTCSPVADFGRAGIYFCSTAYEDWGMACHVMGDFAYWGGKVCARTNGKQTQTGVKVYVTDRGPNPVFAGYILVQNSGFRLDDGRRYLSRLCRRFRLITSFPEADEVMSFRPP